MKTNWKATLRAYLRSPVGVPSGENVNLEYALAIGAALNYFAVNSAIDIAAIGSLDGYAGEPDLALEADEIIRLITAAPDPVFAYFSTVIDGSKNSTCVNGCYAVSES